MMIHAYQEIYLSKAQSVLGEAFDYAVNACNIIGTDFVKMFVFSSICKRMEKGEPLLISGKSGIETVRDIVMETTRRELDIAPKEQFGRSAEYWIGWAVAYYQWWSDQKYSMIFNAITFDKLQRMYYTLHEADVSKFVSVADSIMKGYYQETRLKRFRTTYGCSQSELATLSGVSLRSIQMYEQRKKDINKASVNTVYRIAKTLGCAMEDLVEYYGYKDGQLMT